MSGEANRPLSGLLTPGTPTTATAAQRQQATARTTTRPYRPTPCARLGRCSAGQVLRVAGAGADGWVLGTLQGKVH